MTRPDQKADELDAVKLFAEILGGFPPGQIEPGETPEGRRRWSSIRRWFALGYRSGDRDGWPVVWRR